jgi:hypothetical protein
MIQLKLLSADRHTLLRSITVDLTRGRIASPRADEATAAAAGSTGAAAVGRSTGQ